MKTLRFWVLGLLTATAVMQSFTAACQTAVPVIPVAEAVTPEIQALADGLQDDPVRIYNYVHDHIRFVLYFGSKKGAQLTLLEKSGNDFDQSALLVAMLRASGYTNSQFADKGVGYQFGWVFMDYDSPDHRDLHHWLQLTLNNSNWTNTYTYLEDLFFYARGYPTAYYLNDGNTYMFQRVWVTLTLGSTNYYLDPAFKVSEPVAGAGNLASAMGISSNALMTAAAGTDTGTYVTNLNEANLRSTLAGYTTNLLNNLQSNVPNASVQQILGGWQITPSTATSLSTSNSFETYEWGGSMPVLNWANEPLDLMSTFQITFAGTNYAWFVPQLKGQRISLTFDTSGTAQLWQDDTLLLQHSTSGSSSTTNVVLYINHPVGTWDFNNNLFISSAVDDQIVTNSYQRTNATYAIMYAFEPDWGWLRERQNQLDNYRQQGLSDTSRQVTSETLNVMGLSWMLQTTTMEQMLAAQLGILPQYYHRLGRMAQEIGRGYYVDAYMEVPAAYPSGGDDTAHMTLLTDHYDLFSLFGSAFEHGIIEELQNTNLVGASTVKMLQIANTNKQAVYLASSANWTAGANVKGKLVNYDTTTLNSIFNNYINLGYFVMLPQNGSNHLAGAGSWAGYGYAAFGSSVAMIINGGYHGGFSSVPVTVNVPFVQQTGDNQPAAYAQAPTSTPNPPSADPVDTADGTFQVEHTDLSLGQAEPRGINLSRYYNGTRRFSNPAGMAGGWIHNYAISANTVAAPQAGLGDTTPAQAAPMIAATCAAISVFNGTVANAKNWMVTALISKWGIDQLTKNGVSVNLGKDTLQFVRQPNGVFTPPANCTATLTQNGSAYSLQQRHGNTFNFDSLGRLTNIVDQYSQPLTVSYLNSTSSLPQTVKDWKNRTFTFNYTGSQLTSVADSAGRSVSYGYSTAYNAQGDLASFTDPESKTSTYVYDTNHQITATLDAQSRLVVSNVYNPLGHLTAQYTQGDPNKMWRFFWAGWATVEYDPAGGVSAYFYDDQGRLTTVFDPLQHSTETIYDGQNHIIYTISPLLEINHFVYDGNNNLIQSIDPLGFTNQFVYDNQNNLIRSVDPRGNPSTFGYNNQFSLTGSTNGAGDFVNYAYNSDGTLHTRTDSGGVTTYGYDSTYGQLNSITYPNSLGVENFVTSPQGDVTTHTDPRGFATTFSYNNRRQLTNAVAPTNLTAKVAYDAVGNQSSATDARGNTANSTWSATRQLLATTLPATPQGAPVVTNFYDSRDWLVKTLDPNQQPTLFTNDAAGHLISLTDPVKRTTAFGYDADGRRLATVNAANETNSRTWDARGSLLKLTDGALHTSSRAYDAAGNQITLTNRNGKKWQFQFDGANRLTNTITPLNRKTSQVWNHQGLLASVKDPASQTTSLYYDAKGRLTNRTDNVATALYSYDANDNLTSVTNIGQASSLSQTFDAYARVSSCKDVNGNLIQYRYDANGNVTNLIYPGGRTVTYFYDNLNRLTNVTDWAQRQTAITYDLASRVKSITRPNGTQRVLSYDAAGQTTNIVELTSIGFPVALFKFNWNSAAEVQWEFAAPLPHTNAPPTRSMTYDDDNRLATVNGQSVVNDLDGNLTSGPLTNGTFVTYAFDARSRLSNVGGITNAYDVMNNRIGQTYGTNTTTFVVNPNSKLPQVLMRIKNGVTNYYIYGLGLLYQVTETATTTNTLTYHYDYRGSTIALTDGNGNVTDRIEYSTYGLTMYRAGTNDTPFLFNGRFGVQTDPNGLLYMQARYYNPYLCRFLNPDPSSFSGGLNFYAFANGNPVSFIDPFGLGAVGDSDNSSWLINPNANQVQGQPCIVCHGVSADGFNGDINSFYGLPGGPDAQLGYQTESVIAQNLAPFIAGPLGGLIGEGLVVEGATPNLLYHYTTASESSFANGLWEGTSVTDTLYTDAAQASQELGIPVPNRVIPIQNTGQFVPNSPAIVEPSPLRGWSGGGNDLINPQRVPPSQLLPAQPIGVH